MATFEEQVEGLTSLAIDGSSAPTQSELTQFLTDGAAEVINSMTRRLKLFCATQDTFTSTAVGSEAQPLTSGQVLSVTRSDGTIDQPCREIPAALRGRVSDVDDMNAATTSDPVYYIYNGNINALPASGSCKYLEVNNPSVLYTASNIDNFPNEYEYLVPLYASVKALQAAMSAKSGNSSITTALTAMKTELDKVDEIINTAKGKVDDFYTSIADIDDATELFDATNKRFKVVRDALLKAQDLIDNDGIGTNQDVINFLADADTATGKMNAHLGDGEAILTDDPGSGDIYNALTAMTAAIEFAEASIDKFEEQDSDSVFGDEDTFTTANSQITRVKDALDKVSSLIESNKPASSYDAHDLLQAEDIELLQGNLSIVDAELKRAQTHMAEWNSIGDMRVKEINASLSEASAYGAEIQARLSYAQSYINASSARASESASRLSQASATTAVAAQELSRANVAIAEINSLMASYRLEIEGVAPYLNSASSIVNQAQGYSNEVQTRLAVDSTEYSWMEKQQAKLQADYDKGIQIMRGA